MRALLGQAWVDCALELLAPGLPLPLLQLSCPHARWVNTIHGYHICNLLNWQNIWLCCKMMPQDWLQPLLQTWPGLCLLTTLSLTLQHDIPGSIRHMPMHVCCNDKSCLLSRIPFIALLPCDTCQGASNEVHLQPSRQGCCTPSQVPQLPALSCGSTTHTVNAWLPDGPFLWHWRR
jgi:hypothetical protein